MCLESRISYEGSEMEGNATERHSLIQLKLSCAQLVSYLPTYLPIHSRASTVIVVMRLVYLFIYFFIFLFIYLFSLLFSCLLTRACTSVAFIVHVLQCALVEIKTRASLSSNPYAEDYDGTGGTPEDRQGNLN